MADFLRGFKISLDFSVNAAGSLGQGIPFRIPTTPIPVINSLPVLDTAQVISSMSSSVAFHPTLFEDLGLTAEATYNFYTSDELAPASFEASSSLETLPRYVTLSWNPASAPRDFTLSRKGLRPFDPRTPPVPPALDVATARGAVANGYIAPGVVQALLVAPIVSEPSPRFDEDMFLSSPKAAGLSAAFESGEPSEFHVRSVPTSPGRIRVNFIDPSIAGALDQNRVMLAADHSHLASLGAFSKLASGLEVVSEFNQDASLSNPVPVFPAVPNTPDMMYVGYVLERYTLDPSGSMSLSRTMTIDDPGQSSIVDREVAYGGRYSYRIRALFQWTHGPNVGFFGSSSLDRSPAFNTSVGSRARQASFYAAEWSDWARVAVLDTVPPGPPDELTVRPLSEKRLIRITWKMPDDPQRDISSLSLLRSTGINGRYGEWVKLGNFVPSNGVFVDHGVLPHEESHESYMYAMYSTSFHGQRSVLSERIVARLTDRSRYLGEEPVRLAGPQGDDPTDHPRGPMRRDPSALVASARAVVYVRGGDSSLPLFDRPYVVEVQSLATGERAEVTLNVDTTDVGRSVGGTGRPA